MREYLSTEGRLEKVAEAFDETGWYWGSLLEDAVWPLPNVWLGVSVENQQTADERIPWLMDTPGKHWLSAEPLLEGIDIRRWLAIRSRCRKCGHRSIETQTHGCAFATGGECGKCGGYLTYETTGIDWVVAGGESGPGARPCNIDWLRSLRDQCKAAGVPYFCKQWGRYPNGLDLSHTSMSRKGDDMSEWPADLRVRELPEGLR